MHPPKLFIDEDDPYFHATSSCPEIPRSHVGSLTVVHSLSPVFVDERFYWSCPSCCPLPLFSAGRPTRPPLVVHADEECPILVEECNRGYRVGVDEVEWPHPRYEQLLNAGEAVELCGRCVANREMLKPLFRRRPAA